MPAFLINNLSTIIIGALIMLMIILIIASMIRDKKKGLTSCRCGCASCPLSGGCANKK
ncbi:MAG: FeoB-associated Cys-rich membrane protein [Clostridia bacterium]|nr:FeoB-associated Cys-rich membrane protein [Clostridia bacterium]MDD4798714.1 FeoB-associated Cys-rich membrane protein [Clostridia bacterium]